MADDPSAVLLLRIWREGEDGAFRARLSGISISGDPTAQERTVAVAASSRDVLVAVEQWLTDFLKGGEPGA